MGFRSRLKRAARKVGGAVTKVPGLSSALTVVTGGAAALLPGVGGAAAKEFATGAAIGGGILAAKGLGGGEKPETDRSGETMRSTEVPFTGGASPGGLEALERQATDRTRATDRGAGFMAELLAPAPPDGAPAAGLARIPRPVRLAAVAVLPGALAVWLLWKLVGVLRRR